MKKENLFKKIFGKKNEEKKSDCNCNVELEEVQKKEKSKKNKDSCCNIVIEEIEE